MSDLAIGSATPSTAWQNSQELERGASLTPQQRELLLDLTQLSLDLIGIVDPTGAADIASGTISLTRGDLLGAAISGVSAFLPYLGDLAKLGKLPRLVETLGRIVDVAKADGAFARAVQPMMEQLRNAFRGADLGFLPDAARRAIRSVEAKVDEFFRTARLARGEGAFAAIETLPYTPAGRVFGQANESSCVAASMRMLLRNGDEVPEAWIRQAANVDLTGGRLSDVPQALAQFGLTGYRSVSGATVDTLEAALARGQPVIASVRTDVTGGAHAVVVDAIRDGKVYIRDPYPPGMGASYAVTVEQFQAAFTGRAVIR